VGVLVSQVTGFQTCALPSWRQLLENRRRRKTSTTCRCFSIRRRRFSSTCLPTLPPFVLRYRRTGLRYRSPLRPALRYLRANGVEIGRASCRERGEGAVDDK